MLNSVQARAKSLVSSLPKTVGHDGLGRDRPTIGNLAHAALSNVVSLLRLSSARNSYQGMTVDSRCRNALAISRTPQFFVAAAPMGIVTRRIVVTTDTSTTGWGALCKGRSVNGPWSAAEAKSHINVLELQTFLWLCSIFCPR